MFDNVAILDRDLVLNRVRDLVNMTLPRWQTSSFAEVEAALTFLYQLGEALPVSHGNHFSGDAVSFFFFYVYFCDELKSILNIYVVVLG